MMEQGVERRRFPRVSYPCRIKLSSSGFVFLTDTEDISCGGICVGLKQALDIYSNVSLEIDLRDNKPLAKCEGGVVWCLKDPLPDNPDKVFHVGIEFLDISEENTVRIKDIVGTCLKKEQQQQQYENQEPG